VDCLELNERRGWRGVDCLDLNERREVQNEKETFHLCEYKIRNAIKLCT